MSLAQRALRAIEHLVDDDFMLEVEMRHAAMEGCKRFRGDSKIMAERLLKIYRFAHSANKHHSCHRVHTDWRNEILEYLNNCPRTE